MKKFVFSLTLLLLLSMPFNSVFAADEDDPTVPGPHEDTVEV
jgi:hypothetical protein